MLESQVMQRDFRPVYLFTGNAGTGKTTVARIFAEAITGSPDEIMEIDAASNNGVDSILVLREHAQMRPMYGDYKVYIIDECHSLSTSSFTALLKLLEEPPEYAIFILCTTDVQKLPMTIISRSARYKFTRLRIDELVDRLRLIAQKEGRVVEDVLLYALAKRADGSMREGISLLDACLSYVKTDPVNLVDVEGVLGVGDKDIHKSLMRSILASDSIGVTSALEEIYRYGDNWGSFLGDWVNFLLGIREMQLIDRKLFGEEFEGEEFLLVSSDKIVRLIDQSMDALSKVRFDPFPRYRVEALFLGFVNEVYHA